MPEAYHLNGTFQGLSLKNDDEIRNKIRTYQSIDFDELTLNEVEDLIDQLRKIDTKLPYLVLLLSLASNWHVAAIEYFQWKLF